MDRRAAISRFVREDRGATAIEYALIAAGIAVAVAASVYQLGDSVTALWQKIADATGKASS
jgi:pilus assembly protein Flp/PilA